MRFWKRKRGHAAASVFSLPMDGDLQMDNPDWVLVQGASLETVRQAVVENASITTPENPTCHMISLYQLPDSSVAILSSPAMPPLDAMNLCIWIAGVGSTISASCAIMWATSPTTGMRFALYPDNSNAAGDTLVGYNNNNESVSAYAPEGFLRLESNLFGRPSEPVLELGNPIDHFEVLLDSDSDFGNRNLECTHRSGQAW